VRHERVGISRARRRPRSRPALPSSQEGTSGAVPVEKEAGRQGGGQAAVSGLNCGLWVESRGSRQRAAGGDSNGFDACFGSQYSSIGSPYRRLGELPEVIIESAP
jgi:hypothetical protein